MTTDTHRNVPHANDTPSEWKASDFFPPGTGWNQSPRADDKQSDELDASAPRPDLGHH